MREKHRTTVKTKEKKRCVGAAILLALALLAGCGKTADPIDLPPDDAVTGIGVVTMNGDGISVMEADRIVTVMNVLRAAKPTRTPSVNDRPTNVTACGTVSIHAGGNTTVVYYYERDNRHYIEQPYRGIYRTEDSLEDLLFQPD